MAILLTLLTLLGLAVLIRILGSIGKVWGIIPAQTFALVVTWANKTTEFTKGAVGGTVENILHGIPGRKILRAEDPMDWKVVKEEESRSLLFHLLGVQWIGIFRALRLNKLQMIRYGKKEDEKEYHGFSEDSDSRFIFFSSSTLVNIKNAETAGVYALDWEFIIISERTFPIRSVLRVPDPYANLSVMARNAVIGVTSLHSPEDFLSGEKSDAKKDLAIAAIMGISKRAEEELGLTITEVTLNSVSPEERYRESLELGAKVERENAAALAKQKNDTEIGILANSVEADQVERVVMRIAENPGAIRVRALEAYERNQTVKVYAPGSNLSQILPSLQD